MATTIQPAKKIGGSLMIRIPKDIAVLEHIHEGDLVSLDVRTTKKDWFGSLKGIGSLKKEEKLDIHD